MTNSSQILTRVGIIILTLATAAIHFRQAFLFPTPDPVFILNGLGYIVLLAALYLPIPQLSRFKSLIRFALIAFTAVTIVAYFVVNGFFFFPIGYLDKAIEIVLIVLLFMDARFASRRA